MGLTILENAIHKKMELGQGEKSYDPHQNRERTTFISHSCALRKLKLKNKKYSDKVKRSVYLKKTAREFPSTSFK